MVTKRNPGIRKSGNYKFRELRGTTVLLFFTFITILLKSSYMSGFDHISPHNECFLKRFDDIFFSFKFFRFLDFFWIFQIFLKSLISTIVIIIITEIWWWFSSSNFFQFTFFSVFYSNLWFQQKIWWWFLFQQSIWIQFNLLTK